MWVGEPVEDSVTGILHVRCCMELWLTRAETQPCCLCLGGAAFTLAFRDATSCPKWPYNCVSRCTPKLKNHLPEAYPEPFSAVAA